MALDQALCSSPDQIYYVFLANARLCQGRLSSWAGTSYPLWLCFFSFLPFSFLLCFFKSFASS